MISSSQGYQSFEKCGRLRDFTDSHLQELEIITGLPLEELITVRDLEKEQEDIPEPKRHSLNREQYTLQLRRICGSLANSFEDTDFEDY